MTTLAKIMTKVRDLTGRKSAVQLTDEQIKERVNDFYTGEFPLEMRVLNLRERYRFLTTPNVYEYPLNVNNIQTVNGPVYIDGYPIRFTQDQTTWHALWPRIKQEDDGNTSDGTVPFDITLSNTPILPKSVSVGGKVTFTSAVAAIDDGNGGFTTEDGSAAVGGTIDYETGDITSLDLAIPSGETINVNYYSFFPSRPYSMLYYDNVLQLYPVPDRVYDVETTIYKNPSEMLNTTDSPEVNEWWEALAYGAAMKIFEDNKDLQSAGEMLQLLDRKYVLIRRLTWFNLSNQRTRTIYSSDSYDLNQFWGYIPGTY